MTRPAFLLLTLSTVMLGLASAASAGPLALWRALATLLLACLAHAGGNVLNDYHDARNGADAANRNALSPFTGGARLIQDGQVTERDTARWALWLLLATSAGGVVLASVSGAGLWLIGAAGLVLAWAYSAPPLALMARGLGEAAVAACWWLVVLGADYVQRGALAALPALLGGGLALLVANLLLINGFPDAPADARVGKRTLVVRLGPAAAARLYLGLALLAHAVVPLAVLAGWAPTGALAGLLSLPLSLVAGGLLWRHRRQAARLRPAIGLTIAAANLHALALAAGLVLGR
ncbi:prenyltransferase [Ottowia sp.]|uniref:prenyltransferase n=1 Tax=Ottowia sp. TaxID=1898956 RepID=UPI002BE8EFD8|nr:prenyltransferase [Ottowia sp.]HNR84148.1 prenyltransferase [Ottowia sp.]